MPRFHNVAVIMSVIALVISTAILSVGSAQTLNGSCGGGAGGGCDPSIDVSGLCTPVFTYKDANSLDFQCQGYNIYYLGWNQNGAAKFCGVTTYLYDVPPVEVYQCPDGTYWTEYGGH